MDAENTSALIRQGPFWTRDKENRLIGLYSHFSLLWDCRHPDYYRRDRREHAMRAIGAALDNEFDGEPIRILSTLRFTVAVSTRSRSCVNVCPMWRQC